MSISKITLLITSLLLTITLWRHSTASAQGPIPDVEPDYVPGEILVKFKPGLRTADNMQRLAEVGVEAIETISGIGTMRVQVPIGQEAAYSEQLNSRSDVEYAELNQLVYALYSPNDPSFNSQWGLTKINMSSAWDVTQGIADVVVAVVDTGIDLDHEDFSCTLAGGVNKLTDGYDFAYGDADPDDDNSHGSHVAGIIGACTNNSVGIAGVAPNVRLMPVKVLDSGGSGSYAGVASGIMYAADNGAKIINLSLGGTGSSSTMSNAIDYAVGKGALVVAAAGNCAQGYPCSTVNPIIYPAAYDNTFAVGATTSSDSWASYSEYHDYVDVTAPGSSIYSTWSAGGYGYKSGTSMATPHVAGLAALIWSVDPDLTHNEVQNAIQISAKDLGTIGKDDYYGYGRIDAYQALIPFMELQETTGQSISSPITFLVDDLQTNPTPNSKQLQVVTSMTSNITWTANISPSVSWVNVTPPGSGQISMASVGQFILTTTKPVTYGTYTTTLVVTGTTATGLELGPIANEIRINYVQELQIYYFPIMFKN